MTRSAASKPSCSAAAAAPLGQKRSRDIPASSAHAVPVGKCRRMDSGVVQSVADTSPFTSSSCDAVAEPAAASAPSSSSAGDNDKTHDATFNNDVVEECAADVSCTHLPLRVFDGRKVVLSCRILHCKASNLHQGV